MNMNTSSTNYKVKSSKTTWEMRPESSKLWIFQNTRIDNIPWTLKNYARAEISKSREVAAEALASKQS